MRRDIHTELIDSLEKIVSGDFTLREYEYKDSHKRVIGEIDYLVWNQSGFIVDLFEVKSTKTKENYSKAVRQLRRHNNIYLSEQFCFPYKQINYYLVYGRKKDDYKPIIEEIPAHYIKNRRSHLEPF